MLVPDLDIYAPSAPLPNQVAGHQNVMSDESGSLVIKPALPREFAFYHMLNSASRSSALGKLKPFVPKFYGTLKLEGQLDSRGGVSKQNMSSDEPMESVVLENLAQHYTHPCVLDVKLGTVLHDPDASDEKRRRMEKQAMETTSKELGIRFTGSQTWHEPSSSYILTPRSFGKSLTTESLSSGLTRFFPLPSDVLPSLMPPSTPATASSSSGATPTGAVSHVPSAVVNSEALTGSLDPIPTLADPSTSTSSQSPPGPSQTEYKDHAISPRVMVHLLDLVEAHLQELEIAVSGLEARFIGSSVLLVYEGDPARLQDALDRVEAKRTPFNPTGSIPAKRDFPDWDDGLDNSDGSGGSGRNWLGIGDESDEEDEEDEESDDEDDDDDDDGTKADERSARKCPPLTVKMIDFAHTRLVEGEGIDLGVLKGLRTLRGLVKGRREVVARAAQMGRGANTATVTGTPQSTHERFASVTTPSSTLSRSPRVITGRVSKPNTPRKSARKSTTVGDVEAANSEAQAVTTIGDQDQKTPKAKKAERTVLSPDGDGPNRVASPVTLVDNGPKVEGEKAIRPSLDRENPPSVSKEDMIVVSKEMAASPAAEETRPTEMPVEGKALRKPRQASGEENGPVARAKRALKLV